jgi:arabinogalactan endo-1,4-beta-galactosidase
MEQQEWLSSNCCMQVCLTYHYHVFYVKPSMSQTPKLWLHVFQNISSVLNSQTKKTIVWQFKFAQKLMYHDFPLRGG